MPLPIPHPSPVPLSPRHHLRMLLLRRTRLPIALLTEPTPTLLTHPGLILTNRAPLPRLCPLRRAYIPVTSPAIQRALVLDTVWSIVAHRTEFPHRRLGQRVGDGVGVIVDSVYGVGPAIATIISVTNTIPHLGSRAVISMAMVYPTRTSITAAPAKITHRSITASSQNSGSPASRRGRG